MTQASPCFIGNNRAVRYAAAIVATAMTLLLRWALNPILGDYVPYILLFPAVAFSAWYCGIGPSLLRVVLAAVGGTVLDYPSALLTADPEQGADGLGYWLFSAFRPP